MVTRDLKISVRFSEDELAFLSELAQLSGLSLSSYIRMSALLRAQEQYQRAVDRTDAEHAIRESAGTGG